MMRAAVAQFFTEYDAALGKEVAASNKAYEAQEAACCYLADFTFDGKGLTPEEAHKLRRLMGAFESAQADADMARAIKDEAIHRLGFAFRKPCVSPPIR